MCVVSWLFRCSFAEGFFPGVGNMVHFSQILVFSSVVSLQMRVTSTGEVVILNVFGFRERITGFGTKSLMTGSRQNFVQSSERTETSWE
jgi:hypothetical protein